MKTKKIKLPEEKLDPNRKKCGERPDISQDVYNPMQPCNLPKGHKGPHNWVKF